MSDRLRSGSGTHSSRHLVLLALLTWAAVAAGQEAGQEVSKEAAAPSPHAAVAAASAAPAPAAAESAVAKSSQPDSKPTTISPPLQLYLGSAKDLLRQEQWDTIVASQATDPADEDDLPALGHDADVEVEGKRRAPNVPGGFGGLFWALRHPTQAWRIFVPAPSE